MKCFFHTCTLCINNYLLLLIKFKASSMSTVQPTKPINSIIFRYWCGYLFLRTSVFPFIEPFCRINCQSEEVTVLC
ncbi:hypothetical protein ACB098_03G145000 [Castanea mollissima]